MKLIEKIQARNMADGKHIPPPKNWPENWAYDWRFSLDPEDMNKVVELQNKRTKATFMYHFGKMSRDEARGIIAECSREIARIAEGAT